MSETTFDETTCSTPESGYGMPNNRSSGPRNCFERKRPIRPRPNPAEPGSAREYTYPGGIRALSCENNVYLEPRPPRHTPRRTFHADLVFSTSLEVDWP